MMPRKGEEKRRGKGEREIHFLASCNRDWITSRERGRGGERVSKHTPEREKL